RRVLFRSPPELKVSGVASRATRMGLVAVPERARAVLVIAGVIGEVFARFDSAYPAGVFPIPTDRCGQAGFEIGLRTPPGFAHELGARKRVAAIVPQPILDCSEQAVRRPGGGQNLSHDGEIRKRAVSTDVINF